jgi:hypothetical protein
MKVGFACLHLFGVRVVHQNREDEKNSSEFFESDNPSNG